MNTQVVFLADAARALRPARADPRRLDHGTGELRRRLAPSSVAAGPRPGGDAPGQDDRPARPRLWRATPTSPTCCPSAPPRTSSSARPSRCAAATGARRLPPDPEHPGPRRSRARSCVAFLLSFLLARRITGPVGRLVRATEAVRVGNLEAPDLPVESKDEIGILARSFRAMLEELKEKAALEKYVASLDDEHGRGRPRAGRSSRAATRPEASAEPQVGTALRRRGTRSSRVLGKGGMGIVYRAHDRDLDDVGGDQDPARRSPLGGSHAARPVQAGDPPRPADHPPEHPAHARPGRVERPSVPLDGVRQGDHAQAPRRSGRHPAHPRRAADLQADVRGARRGARGRRHPPRHQAAEHHHRADRRPEDHGLRHRAPHGGPRHDRDGDRRRDARLHVARAGPRASRSISGPTSTRPASSSTRSSRARSPSRGTARWRSSSSTFRRSRRLRRPGTRRSTRGSPRSSSSACRRSRNERYQTVNELYEALTRVTASRRGRLGLAVGSRRSRRPTAARGQEAQYFEEPPPGRSSPCAGTSWPGTTRSRRGPAGRSSAAASSCGRRSASRPPSRFASPCAACRLGERARTPIRNSTTTGREAPRSSATTSVAAGRLDGARRDVSACRSPRPRCSGTGTSRLPGWRCPGRDPDGRLGPCPAPDSTRPSATETARASASGSSLAARRRVALRAGGRRLVTGAIDLRGTETRQHPAEPLREPRMDGSAYALGLPDRRPARAHALPAREPARSRLPRWHATTSRRRAAATGTPSKEAWRSGRVGTPGSLARLLHPTSTSSGTRWSGRTTRDDWWCHSWYGGTAGRGRSRSCRGLRAGHGGRPAGGWISASG